MTINTTSLELPTKAQKKINKAHKLYIKSEYERALGHYMDALESLDPDMRYRVMDESGVGEKIKQCTKITKKEKTSDDIEYEKQAA